MLASVLHYEKIISVLISSQLKTGPLTRGYGKLTIYAYAYS